MLFPWDRIRDRTCQDPASDEASLGGVVSHWFPMRNSKKAGLPQCRRIEPKAMDRPSVRAGHVIYIRTYYAHAWKGAEWTAGREGKEQVCRHWPPQHRKGAPHKNRAQGGSRHLRACVNIQVGDIQTRAQIYKQRKDCEKRYEGKAPRILD